MRFLLIFCTALIFVIGAKSQGAVPEEIRGPVSATRFEEADAWDIAVEKRVDLPEKGADHSRIHYSFPDFSRDSQRLLYFESRPAGRGPRAATTNLIIIHNLESGAVKEIILSASDDRNIRRACAAFSHDQRRIVCGPLDGKYAFIEMQTEKITWLSWDIAGDRIVWPNHTNIYVVGAYYEGRSRFSAGLDLETLGEFEVPKDLIDYTGKNLKRSAQKNARIDLRRTGDSAVSDPVLIIASLRSSYSKVLAQGIHVALNDDQPVTWAVWTPDLRNIFYLLWTEGPTLLRLGLRPTPMLDFEIKGFDSVLTDVQRRQLKKSFDEGKKIWAEVHGARVNPLNDKVIGPDEGKFRGRGFLTQLNPVMKFKFAFEVSPASTGNVVSAFQVGEQNWASKVWGQLVAAGDPTASGLRIPKDRE